jgi:hypothetical protein
MKNAYRATVAGLCFFTLACGSPQPRAQREAATVPDVLAVHQPMHPADGEAVTFKATAVATKLTLRYERSALTLNQDGTMTQSIVEPLTTLKTCKGSGASPLTCEHRPATGYPAGSLIRFDAVAEGNGGAVGSESYFFAAGTYPDKNAAVPIRLKTSNTAGLDLVFIGTSDLSTADLRASLQDVVYQIYFKYPEMLTARAVYNYYYSSNRGDYTEDCSFSNPANMAVLEATGDAVVFLHRATLRDCKVGKRIASEIDNEKSLVHESGHVLFDLQDEYCCDSSYKAQQCVPNLWSSQQQCESAAAALGYEKSFCRQLKDDQESLPFWRIDPDGETGCIMGDGQHNPGSAFRTACQKRIAWRHQKCLGGRCFTSPVCP